MAKLLKIKLLSFISTIVLYISAIQLNGQTVLMHETIKDYDFKLPRQGPNFRHFNYLYLGYAFFVPSGGQNEIETKPANTTIFTLGWRYKFKLTNWFSVGTGINYSNEIFDLKQNEGKLIPDTILHSKEKLKFNSLGTEVYFRFNFGKRGNIVGRFLDIGAYWAWAFKVKDVYQDKPEQINSVGNASKQKVVLSNLDYVEPFHYGLKVRFGINRFVLAGSYRLNELLTKEYKQEVGDLILPQLALGLEIGLHK